MKYEKEYFSKIRRESVKQKKKSAPKIRVLLKFDKNNGYFTGRPTYIYNISLNSPENETSPGKGYRENQNTNFMFNNFISENRIPLEIWENGRAIQAAQDNIAHANCILDT